MHASRSPSLVSLILLVAAISSTARPADAEPSAADRQAATVLFKDGKALLDKGKIAEACRKLEDSQRLDPAAGTLLNLAVCHEKEGRTASAWYEFTDALATARKDNRPERIKLAEEHIAKLEPQLLRLTIEVPKESDVPGLEVRRDDAVLARAGWGSATPVDPGEHKIEAKAPGKLPWSRSVNVDATQATRTITVPALAADPDAGKMVAKEPIAPPVAPPSQEPTPVPATSTRGRNGVIATAVGGAFLVGAGVVGLVAKSKWDEAQKTCPSVKDCDASGAAATKRAGTLADTATTVGVIGAVLTGVGVYLLSTAPSSSSATASKQAAKRFVVSPIVAQDGGGAFVSGAF
jgi:tetratricopeptide (TPR) repeat protein